MQIDTLFNELVILNEISKWLIEELKRHYEAEDDSRKKILLISKKNTEELLKD